jgi:hypothetical protein
MRRYALRSCGVSSTLRPLGLSPPSLEYLIPAFAGMTTKKCCAQSVSLDRL